MILIDFKEITSLDEKAEIYKAKLLCFFALKENNQSSFQMSDITEMFVDAGYNKPNISRLKSNLIEKKIFKEADKFLVYVPATFQELSREYNKLWDKNDSVESDSEVLDEKKFCGKKSYLDHLVYQINATYRNNCFDACAVLMRRLFEISLILTYRNFGIDAAIRDTNGNYFVLDKIIKDATVNTTLSVSRISSKYSEFQKTGNFSAHRIEYIGSKSDIDRILLDYRAAIEELFIKAGL